MSQYTFKSEEPVWYKSEWEVNKNDEGEPVMDEEEGDVVDSYDHTDRYYWIVSEDRDDVLIVPSFMAGEEAVMELETTQKMFEDFVNEEDNPGYKIVEDEKSVY